MAGAQVHVRHLSCVLAEDLAVIGYMEIDTRFLLSCIRISIFVCLNVPASAGLAEWQMIEMEKGNTRPAFPKQSLR